MAASGAIKLRCFFFVASRAAAKIGGFDCASPSFSVKSRVRRGGEPAFVAREGDGAGEQIAVDDLIDDAKFQGIRGADGIAHGAHFHCLRDSGQAGQALRSGGAGDDAEFHFGLADLRGRNRDAIMARHGGLESAAQRGAVDRGHDGLRGGFNPVQDDVEAGAPFAGRHSR